MPRRLGDLTSGERDGFAEERSVPFERRPEHALSVLTERNVERDLELD